MGKGKQRADTNGNTMLMKWSDITLNQFEKIMDIQDKYEDIERMIALVGLFNDMTQDEVLTLPVPEFKKYIEGLAWMEEQPEIKQPQGEYTLNGKKYILTMNYHKLTTAQYIDWQSYVKDSTNKRFRLMLSVFLIPKGHKYQDGYDVEEVMEDLGVMCIEDALALSAFFLIWYRSLSRALLKYSSRILRKAAKREKNPELMETVKQMENLADMFGFR